MNFRTAAAALLGLLLLSIPAQAIGIGPGRIEVKFEPNTNASYEFAVMNNEGKELEISLYKSGDLAKYVTVDSGTFRLAPNEVRRFTFNVSFPPALEPGLHDTRIGAVGIPPQGATVAAVAGVEMQFWVYVDYPEKYVSVDITHTRPFLNRPVVFNVTLFNPVNRSMAATADLEISEDRNGTSVMIERFDLGGAELASGARHVLQAEWTPANYGDYTVVARAYFDGGTSRKEMGLTLTPPNAPASGETEAQPQAQTAIDIWRSPYTHAIMILIIITLAVLLWPEKKRERDGQKE
ncbi:MAG: hypothetical protein QXD77_02220 [Candidatus Aenigmatarchaeota archaeon]